MTEMQQPAEKQAAEQENGTFSAAPKEEQQSEEQQADGTFSATEEEEKKEKPFDYGNPFNFGNDTNAADFFINQIMTLDLFSRMIPRISANIDLIAKLTKTAQKTISGIRQKRKEKNDAIKASLEAKKQAKKKVQENALKEKAEKEKAEKEKAKKGKQSLKQAGQEAQKRTKETQSKASEAHQKQNSKNLHTDQLKEYKGIQKIIMRAHDQARDENKSRQISRGGRE